MIEVKNVYYKNILKNINLTLSENKFIGIIGPNGSGKSTLVKTICGQVTPCKGQVFINNKNVGDMSLKERAATMAVLSQNMCQDLNFKVIDIVLMGLYSSRKNIFSYTKAERDFATSALEKVGIDHLSERIFSTLSGGERQRTLIARAICQKVDLLILDEPLNHLDIFYQLQIMKLIKSFGITVICVLHDFIMALKFCDELVVIKEGLIYKSGPTTNLINSSILKEVFNIDANIICENHKYGVLY